MKRKFARRSCVSFDAATARRMREVDDGGGSRRKDRASYEIRLSYPRRQPPPDVSGGVGSHLMRIQWSTVVAGYGASCASLFCVASRRAAPRYAALCRAAAPRASASCVPSSFSTSSSSLREKSMRHADKCASLASSSSAQRFVFGKTNFAN